MEVYIEAIPEQARHHKEVRSKWLDDDKGDVVRSRLVAQEVREWEWRDDVNAGTPPLKLVRVHLSLAASSHEEVAEEQVWDGEQSSDCLARHQRCVFPVAHS